MISIMKTEGMACGVTVGGRWVVDRVGVNLAGFVAVLVGNGLEGLVGRGVCLAEAHADRRTVHKKKISNNLQLKIGIFTQRFFQARS
jgi:hypothetical protein